MMSDTIKVLDYNSESVKHLCRSDEKLSNVIHIIGEIEYVTAEDSYAFLIEHIVGQMLSNKVADLICKRLYSLCDNKLTPEHIDQLTDAEMLSVGISRSKTCYIRSLTEVIKNNSFDFKELEILNDDEVLDRLTSLRGIGNWTAKMYLIFFLDRNDVLPFEDVAFLQAYKWLYNTDDLSRKSIVEQCKAWKPYSSIAARYLYKALDKGLTKTIDKSGI